MIYNIEALKKMVDNYTMNIKMFSSYSSESSIERMHEMVANRRLIAAIIENDGDDSFLPRGYQNGNVFFDSMLYSAQAGADTSWWTKGT